jgi:hypothetical protein
VRRAGRAGDARRGKSICADLAFCVAERLLSLFLMIGAAFTNIEDHVVNRKTVATVVCATRSLLFACAKHNERANRLDNGVAPSLKFEKLIATTTRFDVRPPRPSGALWCPEAKCALPRLRPSGIQFSLD